MSITWGSWTRQNWWKLVLLVLAARISFSFPIFSRYPRSVAQQRTTGLAAVRWDPLSMWQQSSFLATYSTQLPFHAYPSLAVEPDIARADEVRKIVRTEVLDLEVRNPSACLDQIHQLAEHIGGYMVSSGTGDESDDATIAVRVPDSRFEEARSAIRKMGTRVLGDKLEARDVTKDYVDLDAQLRNLRATETQYLGIMKRAFTVRDTVDVTEKLNAVRGEIEKQRAEFATLSKQVETVSITVVLHAQADAQVFGIHWRPWFHLKTSAREGLEGLGVYAAGVTSAFFYLPALLLWTVTILLICAVGWRFLRWAWKKLFLIPRAQS